MGIEGIDAAAGKKVSSGSPPRRGERIEETARVGGRIAGRRPRTQVWPNRFARKREAKAFYHVRYAEDDARQAETERTSATAGRNKAFNKSASAQRLAQQTH